MGRDGDTRPAARTGTTRLHSAGVIPWRDDPWRSPLDAVLLVALTVSFWWAAGTPGLRAGVGLVVAWYLLPTVAVSVVGAILLAGLVAPGAPLTVVAVPTLALFGLLISNLLGAGLRRDVVFFTTNGAVMSTVTVAVALETGKTWLAGVALLLLATAGYVALDLLALSRTRSDRDE